MINAVSISDLKQNTAKVIKRIKDKGKSVIILQRSKAAAVLVDPDYYNTLEQILEDSMDLKTIEDRQNDPTIKFEDYFIKRFGKNAKKRLLE